MVHRIALFALAVVACSAQTPTFTIKNNYTVGTAPASIVTADFNGDGKPDLATMDIISFSVSVLLGNGDGTFRALQINTLPCQPVHMAVGDFVKDGKPDLLIVCISSPTILILPGRGDGTFSPPLQTSAPVSVLGFLDYLRPGIGDFNGDGFLDLTFIAFDPSTATTSVTGGVYFMPGKGNGSFGAAQLVTGVTGASISVGDFNKDGKADLVISSPKNLSVSAISGTPPGAGPITILLGNGDGTFKIGNSYNLSFGPGPVAVADVNGDGIQDLVINGMGGGVAVFLGKGDGTFNQTYGQSLVGNGTVGLPVLSPIRGLSTPDILLPLAFCCAGSIDLLAGNGDGTFQNLAALTTGISSTSLVSADFDGDGRPDIAAVSFPLALETLQNLMNYIFHTGGPGPQAPGSVAILTNITSFPVHLVNAASFAAGSLAPESIVTAFGGGLATGTGSAKVVPLPTTLNGATLGVTDALGTTRLALLFYSSPTQINFEVPAGTAIGAATAKVTVGAATFSSTLQVVNVAPGVFALNSQGLSAAQVLRVHADTSQTLENVYQVDAAGNVTALPIDFGDPTDQLYLLIYATGVRNAKNVALTVGTASIPVLFSGAQGQFAGEDQVNVGPLPRSLAGQGSVKLALTADGIAANATSLTFK